MATPKTIYCPECGKRVATHDGKSTNNILVKCTLCKKLVVFYPHNGETVTKKTPPRQFSSGKRFY